MKIAFAGTGYINKIHAQAAKNLGLDLVAVVNHKQDSMAEFGEQFNITRQYETVEAMLTDGNVDALVVSTPNYLLSTRAADDPRAQCGRACDGRETNGNERAGG